jgi:hypothetical protein
VHVALGKEVFVADRSGLDDADAVVEIALSVRSFDGGDGIDQRIAASERLLVSLRVPEAAAQVGETPFNSRLVVDGPLARIKLRKQLGNVV